MPQTRIRKLHFHGFQQFRDTTLDFTDPATGKAADRICLIGRNGTGKSTVLRVLDAVLGDWNAPGPGSGAIAVELEHDLRRLVLGSVGGAPFRFGFDLTASRLDGAELVQCDDKASFRALRDRLSLSGGSAHEIRASLNHGVRDLLAYCPPEAPKNAAVNLNGMPKTNLSEALGLMSGLPYRHEISNEQIESMWRTLVYLVKKRENDRQVFENDKDNLHKTKAQLIAEFDASNPPVLDRLGELWNRILAPAGLEFDVEGARIPVQLTENLEAHIRVKETGQPLQFSHLSTGIRNFIFRIGHLFLLYFNRSIERGFVLVDEPENSLFPDFLFDLVDTYDEILRLPDGSTHTQLFMATHSPIVAAQFEPHERVILEWAANGSVTSRKGTAPRGDDPNDLLEKDFDLPHLMGSEGRKQWAHYQDLRKRIRRAPQADRPKLVAEAARIASLYGFEP